MIRWESLDIFYHAAQARANEFAEPKGTAKWLISALFY